MSKETALFDPGFAPLVEPFIDNIEVCHQILASQKSFHQKKFRFQTLSPQIKKLIENNVAFYYGCLLWAFFLVSKYKDSPAEILGNQFLALSEEEVSKYDFMEQINTLKEYIVKFEKDTRYYTGKNANIPLSWIDIIDLYIDFVCLNSNFTSTVTTTDIKLPQILANIDLPLNLRSEIDNAIANKSIETLLNINLFT